MEARLPIDSFDVRPGERGGRGCGCAHPQPRQAQEVVSLACTGCRSVADLMRALVAEHAEARLAARSRVVRAPAVIPPPVGGGVEEEGATGGAAGAGAGR
jgi:hypothetical protein